MTAVEQMARFATRVTIDELSGAGRLQLKIRILDALGCAIAALASDPVEKVRQFVGDCQLAGRCSLIDGARSTPDRAALLNGTLVRYLDFNDSYLAAGETCYPSDNFAGVLAAAELAHADGTTLLTALAVAYQVQCRLSDAAPVRRRGFDHPTHLAYSLAAGASRALSLNREQTANAIAMSGAALNSLRVTRTGTLSHWKGLAAPFAASAAMQAVMLSQRGIAGPIELIEGSKGFEESVAGPFVIDWEREGLDRIERTVVRCYSADVHAQTAIDALLGLQRAHGLQAAAVRHVEVDIFDVGHRTIGGGEDGDKMLVFSKEDADHSLPYLMAVALLDHQVMPSQFLPERIERADVQRLLCKVTVRPSMDYSARFPNRMPARVTVTLNDGRVFTRESYDYPGFWTRPQKWEDATKKFRALAASCVSETVLANVTNAVHDIEHIAVAELTYWLRKLPAPSVIIPRRLA